jgi:hypothetical protein
LFTNPCGARLASLVILKVAIGILNEVARIAPPQFFERTLGRVLQVVLIELIEIDGTQQDIVILGNLESVRNSVFFSAAE